MAVDLDKLFAATAALIAQQGLPDRLVGQRFQAFISALTHFDYTVVFAYRSSDCPIDLYDSFTKRERHVFVNLYQEGAYLLDPFYHQARAAIAGLFRMSTLAPDRFFSSEYYRTYYQKTGLAEELGFFVPVQDGVTIALSLMRRESSGEFTNREFSTLRQAEPAVAAFVKNQWSTISSRFDAIDRAKPKTIKSSNHGTGAVWQKLRLTGQECRVIELVLQGHSSESIGLKLGISTGTVKVHRRNVYRKLGISSQTQLLSIYLDGLLKK